MSSNDFQWVSVKPSAVIFRLMDWRMLLKTRRTPSAASLASSWGSLLYPNDGANYLRLMPDSEEEDTLDRYDQFQRHA
jgi:hypothetical protein